MEELFAKFLVQSGPIGAVLVILYVLHELSRLQKFVEDELDEIRADIAGHGDQLNELDKNDAVLEERLRHTRGGKPVRRGDSDD